MTAMAIGQWGMNRGMDEPFDKAEIATARAWIRKFVVPTKTIRRKYSSYILKHVAEHWGGTVRRESYITNGAFIEAARLEGYKIAPIGMSPNAYFNMHLLREAYAMEWSV